MIKPVDYVDGRLIILDQSRLPLEEVYIEIKTAEELFDAIKTLKVRGAPAIGVAAAIGVFAVTEDCSAEEFPRKFQMVCEYIKSARPTAVNLFSAIERMQRVYLENGREALEEAGLNMLIEDLASGKRMGELGLSLLEPNMGILTHCNAGKLATAGMGTCLAPIYLGNKRGYNFKVYADETRPLLQGARLTAWELCKEGVDVTVLCDNMAASLMKQGKIDAVVVGCDRLAGNGDGANKIGTLNLAILAKAFEIPFYMFAPASTVDLNTETGDDITIEMRDAQEVGNMWYEQPMIPQSVNVYNPAFDVTPHEYISGIVTDKGIIKPPFDIGLAKLFKQ